jgi:hypothetical protein
VASPFDRWLGPASLVVGTASRESVDATVREILRLKYACGATERAIGIARSAVAFTLARVAAATLHWLLPATQTDRVLEPILYPSAGRPQGLPHRARNRIGHVFIASYAGPAPH